MEDVSKMFSKAYLKSLEYDSKGMAKVKLNDKYGFITRAGKIIGEIKYNIVYDFCDDIARVILNNQFCYIDREGKEICQTKFVFASDFHNGFGSVKIGEKFYLIGKNGIIRGEAFDEIVLDFADGLIRVKKGKYYGLIDAQNESYFLIIEYITLEYCPEQNKIITKREIYL